MSPARSTSSVLTGEAGAARATWHQSAPKNFLEAHNSNAARLAKHKRESCNLWLAPCHELSAYDVLSALPHFRRLDMSKVWQGVLPGSSATERERDRGENAHSLAHTIATSNSSKCIAHRNQQQVADALRPQEQDQGQQNNASILHLLPPFQTARLANVQLRRSIWSGWRCLFKRFHDLPWS